MNRKIYKIIILVFAILSLNNIILLIRNYSYAYFEKNIKTGVKLKITTLDEMPVKGSPSANTLKEKLGQPGEIIGVTNDNQKVTSESEDIREYRYSGATVNNYVYFNCKDGMEQNTTNCETWRIIGIFKDEEGGEHLKIVNNKILTMDMFPATFVANGTTYKILYTGGVSYSDFAWWNYVTGTVGDKNDWATAGLQYWLNAGSDKETKKPSDGYMSYLSQSAKSMIEDTKYYLGNVVWDKDTAISSYTNERGNKPCSGSCSGGDIWSGNSATWIGKIALMYPSDVGYSDDSSYWGTKITGRDSSWLFESRSHINHEWLLSPSYDYSDAAAAWVGSDGTLGPGGRGGYYLQPTQKNRS